LFRGGRIKVNLIPYNAHEASPYRAPEAEAVDRFRNVLIAGGVQTITRERRGADIRAACGQLRLAPTRALRCRGTPAVGRTGGTPGGKMG
jgi:23S rRNA (adenine2503-C2)-methyltransferase